MDNHKDGRRGKGSQGVLTDDDERKRGGVSVVMAVDANRCL